MKFLFGNPRKFFFYSIFSNETLSFHVNDNLQVVLFKEVTQFICSIFFFKDSLFCRNGKDAAKCDGVSRYYEDFVDGCTDLVVGVIEE